MKLYLLFIALACVSQAAAELPELQLNFVSAKPSEKLKEAKARLTAKGPQRRSTIDDDSLTAEEKNKLMNARGSCLDTTDWSSGGKCYIWIDALDEIDSDSSNPNTQPSQIKSVCENECLSILGEARTNSNCNAQQQSDITEWYNWVQGNDAKNEIGCAQMDGDGSDPYHYCLTQYYMYRANFDPNRVNDGYDCTAASAAKLTSSCISQINEIKDTDSAEFKCSSAAGLRVVAAATIGALALVLVALF